jgi:asparagine synthase (glutamine-hydrolysing)
MCGIIAAAGTVPLGPAVEALSHRGPDAAASVEVCGVTLGHTRLAIQDTSSRSDQPFSHGPLMIVYNGELFNAQYVRALVEDVRPGHEWLTTGDTEVVAAALDILGPDLALSSFDGMFAVAWADERRPGVLSLSRDRQGEIPLHVHRAVPVLAASELKAFAALGRRSGRAVVDVPAGEWWEINGTGSISRHVFHKLIAQPSGLDPEVASERLADAMARSVSRRMISDVPVCSLLSGGIDSAAIALEVTRWNPDLVCYTAVLDPQSRDLRCARETAECLGVDLVEVAVKPPTADDLTSVIHQIELPFKAQVEIGWACLRLAEVISGDGFKVTFTGEGSDELWASYGFAYHGLKKSDWFTYRRDLIASQAAKNFPRVNKSFMAYGVEGRLPFLDPDVVDLALSLPRSSVQDGPGHPKAVLQRAYAGRLPRSVINRPKLAFQDGMGLKTAINDALPNPARYYRAEHQRIYG